jgi:glycosyltransferase involved in cell wall biosynthesis
MSQGLPIIITHNTGGQDLVTTDTGFLVPIRDPKAIADKINWFCDNLNKIDAMSQAAVSKATSITWENYARNIVDSIGG